WRVARAALRIGDDIDIGPRRFRQRDRVFGMLAEHGIEHQRCVSHVARDWTIDIERAEAEIAWPVGDPTWAWPQPYDRAVRARIADGPRHVCSGGQPNLPCRDRRSRSSRRPPGRQPHDLWLALRPECIVDR